MSSYDPVYHPLKNSLYNLMYDGSYPMMPEQTSPAMPASMMLLAALVVLGIFIWAAYSLFNCRGLSTWIKVFTLLAFLVFPGIAPIIFLLYAYFSKRC